MKTWLHWIFSGNKFSMVYYGRLVWNYFLSIIISENEFYLTVGSPIISNYMEIGITVEFNGCAVLSNQKIQFLFIRNVGSPIYGDAKSTYKEKARCFCFRSWNNSIFYCEQILLFILLYNLEKVTRFSWINDFLAYLDHHSTPPLEKKLNVNLIWTSEGLFK